MGHHYIGTEHLLLGLARLAEGGAMQFLKRNGISPEDLRRETRRVLQESPLTSKPTETEVPSVSPLVQTSLSEYILRVVVRDAATKEQKLEFSIRLDRAQLELAHMTRKIFQGKEVDPIEWTSGDNLIAVVVEKAKD
jgi:ATP-dependent Clp protease ATP-binding subunit ClpA